MRKLLTIDVLSIVRRIYETNVEPDLANRAQAAVRQSALVIAKLVELHQPSHLAAALDHSGSTWRHALYKTYRGKRDRTPAELDHRLSELYPSLARLGLTVMSIPDVESSDVIATVVMRWLEEGRGEAIVVSMDKILLALVASGAVIWDPFKCEWHDVRWVQNRYGVPPEMLPDFLALVGDSHAGISGVSRIGEKTATKLLQSYKTLEGIMAGAGVLKNTLGEILRKERDQAFASLELVRLKTDVHLGTTWKALEYQLPR